MADPRGALRYEEADAAPLTPTKLTAPKKSGLDFVQGIVHELEEMRIQLSALQRLPERVTALEAEVATLRKENEELRADKSRSTELRADASRGNELRTDTSQGQPAPDSNEHTVEKMIEYLRKSPDKDRAKAVMLHPKNQYPQAIARQAIAIYESEIASQASTADAIPRAQPQVEAIAAPVAAAATEAADLRHSGNGATDEENQDPMTLADPWLVTATAKPQATLAKAPYRPLTEKRIQQESNQSLMIKAPPASLQGKPAEVETVVKAPPPAAVVKAPPPAVLVKAPPAAVMARAVPAAEKAPDEEPVLVKAPPPAVLIKVDPAADKLGEEEENVPFKALPVKAPPAVLSKGMTQGGGKAAPPVLGAPPGPVVVKPPPQVKAPPPTLVAEPPAAVQCKPAPTLPPPQQNVATPYNPVAEAPAVAKVKAPPPHLVKPIVKPPPPSLN